MNEEDSPPPIADCSDDNKLPKINAVNVENWSNDASGCLCYYATWYSPKISMCDYNYDTASDTGSMETVFSRSRDVSCSPISPLMQCVSMLPDSTKNAQVPKTKTGCLWCCPSCFNAFGYSGV